MDAVSDGGKHGYWFTYVLWMLLMVFLSIQALFKHFNLSKYYPIAVLGMAVIGYTVTRMPFIHGNYILDCFSIPSFFNWCPWFAVGVLCKCYQDKFNVLMANRYFIFMMFIIVVASFYTYVPQVLIIPASLFLVYHVFNKLYAENWEFKPIRYGLKFFSKIGTYTMEIYFLHYFLLFRLPQPVLNYLVELSERSRRLSFPEFCILGSVAALICVTCICITHILSKVPFLSLLAFGKRTPIKG